MENTLDVLFHNDETTIDEREVREQTFKLALIAMFDKFREFSGSLVADELHSLVFDAMTQTDGVPGFNWLETFQSIEVGWIQQ